MISFAFNSTYPYNYCYLIMNFLAHLYLSGQDNEIRIGNFIADSIKGKQYLKYPEKIQTGIILHRHIDSFTDSHPVIKTSISRFNGSYPKYTGIIVDMLYDHFLACNWEKYSEQALNVFVSNIYKLLIRRYRILPARVRTILPFMIMQNWLVNYQSLSKLQINLEGMARRTNYNSGMEKAMHEIKENYNELSEDFKIFFPEIISFSNNILSRTTTLT